MIEFPETAETEWQIVAKAHNEAAALHKRMELDTLVEREVERLKIRHEAGLLFQQELDEDGTPDLEMLSLADYKGSANAALAPGDLIEGVMKDKGLCLMIGPSGSGKSTLALQTVYCLMTGDDFLGQPVQKIDGAAGILSYDMDAGLTLDWMAGFPNVDSTKVSVVNAFKRGNPLGAPAKRLQIAMHWRSLGVEVVVIDSFSASFFGQDQNDQAATMAHYRDLLLFALTEVGARALIVISHSTTSSPHKIRGSTVHHDVADSIVAVVEDPKTTTREVRMVKYRQHRTPTGGMTHQMNTVNVGAPDNVTHLVSLDTGAMMLAGNSLPASATAAAFDDLPTAHQAPDTDSDTEGDDDL